MLLSSPRALDDHIVHLLASRKSATAKELQSELARSVGTFTIQGIYKELNKLQRAGVLLRSEGRYSLSLSWIVNLAELADEMFHTQTKTDGSLGILPPPGEKHSFRFSRLPYVDDFWMHALLTILQNSKERILYQWIPHPWFHLVHSHKSWPLYNALQASGFRVRSIIGGTTYLDRYSESISKKGTYDYSYSLSPFHGERNRYYSVSDSYLLTVRFDAESTRTIEELYSKVRSAKEYVPSEAQAVINTPGRFSFTIDSRPASVNRILKQFREYFD